MTKCNGITPKASWAIDYLVAEYEAELERLVVETADKHGHCWATEDDVKDAAEKLREANNE